MTKHRESNGKSEAELLTDLRHLSIAAAHELLSGFDRLKELRDEWETDANGHGGGGGGSEARERREKTKSLAYDLAKHEVKHAEHILKLTHAHTEILFEHARSLIHRMRANAPAAAKRPPAVLDLVLYMGSREAMTETLEVRNPFNVDADAVVELSHFTNQSGAKVDGISSTFDTPCVEARGMGHVAIHLAIADGSEITKGVYFADLKIKLIGHVEELALHRLLRVRVREAGKPTA